uniref:Uncharacterized protein n=1 Tax=Timema poppense TaxID=170557 RepID=A0A7R9GX04_TIMPO|nr:unnamed protein product [Timema poppensis]
MINPRVNQWSMMTSPFPTLAICLAYAILRQSIGSSAYGEQKTFQPSQCTHRLQLPADHLQFVDLL